MAENVNKTTCVSGLGQILKNLKNGEIFSFEDMLWACIVAIKSTMCGLERSVLTVIYHPLLVHVPGAKK